MAATRKLFLSICIVLLCMFSGFICVHQAHAASQMNAITCKAVSSDARYVTAQVDSALSYGDALTLDAEKYVNAQTQASKRITVKDKAFKLKLPAYWSGRVKVKKHVDRNVHTIQGKRTVIVTRSTDVLARDGHTLLTITGGTKAANRKLSKLYNVRTSGGAWYASADNTGIGWKSGQKYVVEVTCPDTWTIPSYWAGYWDFTSDEAADNAADLLTGGRVKNEAQLNARGGMLETHIRKYVRQNILKKMTVH